MRFAGKYAIVTWAKNTGAASPAGGDGSASVAAAQGASSDVSESLGGEGGGGVAVSAPEGGKRAKSRAGGAGSDNGNIIIRKYANRRLYDTRSSRYVTLEELAQQIRAGARCEVRDAVTGEDLTRTVLTQILLGEGNHGTALLPEGFLHKIISMCSVEGNNTLFPAYLDMAMDAFVRQQDLWLKMINGGFSGLGAQGDGGGEAAAAADSTPHNGGESDRWSYNSPYAIMQRQVESNMSMFRQWMGVTPPAYPATHAPAEPSANGAGGAAMVAQHNGGAPGSAPNSHGADEDNPSAYPPAAAGDSSADISELRSQLASLQQQMQAMMKNNAAASNATAKKK